MLPQGRSAVHSIRKGLEHPSRFQMGRMGPAPDLKGPRWLLSANHELWEPPTMEMEITIIGLNPTQ